MAGEWRIEERVGDAATLHADWPSSRERPNERAVAVCRVTGPALVLGSAQSASVVDAAAATAADVPVVRRRSGGGAVLVLPEDPVWVDVWVPSDDPLWHPDVGRAFDWLGDAWVSALGRVGVEGVSAHRGGYLACTRWARLACFGGVGTGELVTDDGRKVVGLAQRRDRHGAWFHGAAVVHWDPRPLVGLLDLSPPQRLAAAAELGAAVAGVGDLAGARSSPAGSAISTALVASLP